jgi:hypothetical protein
MSEKDLIKKLYSIAAKQQKIITKLAQQADGIVMPPDVVSPVPPANPTAQVAKTIISLVPGVEVLYAKKHDSALVVGVKVSDSAKWNTFKPSIEKKLMADFGVSTVSWNE